MIINCSPDTIVSWNYFLEGPGHEAIWQKDWTSEQGSILIDGVYYTIKKHGVTSGKWTIENETEVLFTGTKESVFRRSFNIDGLEKTYHLSPVSMFSRSSFVAHNGKIVAMISPKSLFSKKAEIDIIVPDTEFPVIVFAFWLTILMWRRRGRH